jgi:class 3 adenylate cyclase
VASAGEGEPRFSARTSTATRLAASVVAISLVSLVVATLVGVTTGEDLADDLNEEHLQATAESASADVQSELSGLQSTTDGLAASPQASVSVDLFDTAFDELELSIDKNAYEEETEALTTAYRLNYLEPLRAAGRDVQLRDITSASPVARYLQYEYAIDLGAAARPVTLDDAGDGSDWTNIHRRVHPVYREVVTRLDLLDLYLIEPNGDVVYSVSKGPDLGTNMRTGPYSGSVVANTFKTVVVAPEDGAFVSDLRFYDAVPGVPVGAVASPIFEEFELAGVLLVTYSASRLTDLVTADESWEEAGLPETGDVYLFGAGGTTRTDPRAFLEDPKKYLDDAMAEGLIDDSDRALIEAIGTTVLTQSVPDGTADAGFEGDESVRSTSNVTGVPVLSITVPVVSDLVDWFVVAEVNSRVADRGLDDFQELLIVGAAIFVVLLAFAAVAWANGIVRPIRYVSDRISRQSRSEDLIQVSPQTPVEIQQLSSRLEFMKNTLVSQQSAIATARNDRLGLLRSMLPPSVAQRITSGDLRSLDQAPAATVAVVVVLGLADMVRAASGSADRELVDELLGELDNIALEHGLDRIKVIGDAYFAACGHDRPYIDHAPRSIDFAVESMSFIAGLVTDVPLEFAIGVHSGPVTTGMAGGASLVYDVWGVTVSQAHRLARQAGGGEILMGAESRALLPDSVSTESIDGDTYRITSSPEGVPPT